MKDNGYLTSFLRLYFEIAAYFWRRVVLRKDRISSKLSCSIPFANIETTIIQLGSRLWRLVQTVGILSNLDRRSEIMLNCA